MKRDDLCRQLGELDAEISLLATYNRPSNAQAERAKQLAVEADELRDQIAECDRQGKAIGDAFTSGRRSGRDMAGTTVNTITRKSNDELFRAGRGTTDDALRAIDYALEDAVEMTGRSADAAPAVRTIVENNPAVADYLRTTANPDYRSAFGKLMFAGDTSIGLLRMTDAERAAFSAVAEAEQRAALFTNGANGGLAVPLLLDPSVIYTGNGNMNPIRQISRVVTGISNTWTGVSSAGVTASWDSEGVEVSDDTPTLAQPEIVAHKGQAFAQFSVELEGDWNGLMGELSTLFAESKADLEATAFATGTGTEQPIGILTALFAGSVTSGVLPTTDGLLGAVDVYKVFGALPARYRPNASWVASVTVQNQIRSLGDDKLGNQTANLTSGYDFPLLGRPVHELSSMPAWLGTTGAANILVVGDFRNFVVFDRIGARVELVQHLLGSSRRPNGTRGAICWFRTGSDSVNDNGFRMLMNA